MITISINNDGKEKSQSYSGRIELQIDDVHTDNIKDLSFKSEKLDENRRSKFDTNEKDLQ